MSFISKGKLKDHNFTNFSKAYLNRTSIWPYFCRKHAGISNTDMYLESLHKVIEHFYLQDKKNVNLYIKLVMF